MTAETSGSIQLQRLNRQSLREMASKGGTFAERDVSLTNPRALHRNLILVLEDLKYVIRPGVDESVEVKKEALGDYTGHFTSKILGKGEDVYGGGQLTYGGSSEMLIAIGAFLMIVGLVLAFFAGAAGVALVIIGVLVCVLALRSGKKTASLVVMLEPGVGVFVQGEVTEKTEQRAEARVTELEGNALVSVGSVCYIKAIEDPEPKATAAILAIEPRAFTFHDYATSGLLTIVNSKTKDLAASSSASVKQGVDTVISRLSKFSEVRSSTLCPLPHMGLEGKTPAEAAGIQVKGADKWLTLIRNASQHSVDA